MAVYKVTMIFNQCRFGWSETYYITIANTTAAQTAGLVLAKARAKMLGIGVTLEAIRYSDVAIPRICALQIPGTLPGPELIADTPWNAWLIGLCASDLYRRNFEMRGLPDEWIQFDPTQCHWSLAPAHAAAILQWQIAIIQGPWQMRVVTKDATNLTGHDIGILTDDGFGFIQVTVAGLTTAVGEQLKMKGWLGPDKTFLNHSFKVKAKDGNDYTLDAQFAFLTAPGANTGGQAFSQKVSYVNIDSVTPERPVKRSTGRAFFVPRGRRPKAL